VRERLDEGLDQQLQSNPLDLPADRRHELDRQIDRYIAAEIRRRTQRPDDAIPRDGDAGSADRRLDARRNAGPDANRPELRAEYEMAVRGLEREVLTMVEQGASPEAVARRVHQRRRELGQLYKDLTPPQILETIYARNLEKYGDRLGPTIERLREDGRSWEQIIDSSSRPGPWPMARKEDFPDLDRELNPLRERLGEVNPGNRAEFLPTFAEVTGGDRDVLQRMVDDAIAAELRELEQVEDAESDLLSDLEAMSSGN
jgi:hypothetical protein